MRVRKIRDHVRARRLREQCVYAEPLQQLTGSTSYSSLPVSDVMATAFTNYTIANTRAKFRNNGNERKRKERRKKKMYARFILESLGSSDTSYPREEESALCR